MEITPFPLFNYESNPIRLAAPGRDEKARRFSTR